MKVVFTSDSFKQDILMNLILLITVMDIKWTSIKHN